ncbi:hypothetical protein DGG96_17355 [Legionella qingyii]|uniref:Uncharacterized protein n=1 Tax=Legionella qingyii TaxID=2184757 RepID=A0A317TZK5_9GAMM|nr:hypothetical protein DGG96_17355 [Legionella qingyii]
MNDLIREKVITILETHKNGAVIGVSGSLTDKKIKNIGEIQTGNVTNWIKDRDRTYLQDMTYAINFFRRRFARVTVTSKIM